MSLFGRLLRIKDIQDQVETVPVPPEGYTQVVKDGVATNTTTVMHTVTAGKTFYLTGHTFTINSTGAGNLGSLIVTNDADVEQYAIEKTSISIAATIINNAMAHVPPVEIPAGYKIKAVSDDGGLTVDACIFGYEA